MTSSSFRMIDVGEKAPTHRLAVAEGTIRVGAAAFPMIAERRLPKGDALMLAEVAGIQGAKRASDMIPLCHPLPLDRVRVTHVLDAARHSITVHCLVSAFAKTGVEMEAMAGVSSALLTIYDLTKMIEPALTISDARLLVKTGGKSGVWICPEGAPAWLREELHLDAPPPLAGCRAAVVTLSDRAAAGVYADKSGLILAEALTGAGAEVISTQVIPDDEAMIAAALVALAAEKAPDLILTTGGTGIAPRDVTPEAIRRVATREIPGIGELLRKNGADFTRNSWSSRSLAATIGQTLVVALPGSTKAVTQGIACLLPLIPHLLDTIAGKKHDEGTHK
jgi:cyclic pyranopterin monophosphate synthase